MERTYADDFAIIKSLLSECLNCCEELENAYKVLNLQIPENLDLIKDNVHFALNRTRNCETNVEEYMESLTKC